MTNFADGGTMVACAVIAYYFFRYWRRSGDRLFAHFSAAFTVLAFNRLAIAVGRQGESSTIVYLLRLAAFGFIIAGIVRRNMPSRDSVGHASRDQERS
jgi:hypothetical protein